jgi:hypothetical protein
MDRNQDIGAVQRSQEFFRLKQIVQSPGDIYEIDESAKAIYIGPDSDIGEVQVTYFNPDEPLALETAVVAVNGPLVGRVDSLPKTIVPSTGQPARILISPVDIVDNNYDRSSTVVFDKPSRRFNIPAKIDLIIALKALPAIPEVRADRTLRLSQIPFIRRPSVGPPAENGSTDIVIPIYGRRMITVQVIGRGIDASLFLVNLTPGGPQTVPRTLSQIRVPFVTLVPLVSNVRAAVIRASDAARQGTNYDLAGTAISLYAESDFPPDPPSIPGSFPAPRGMSDLLIVNINNNVAIGVADEFATADVFIKLADRET